MWYRTRSDEDRVGGVEERYNLTDALAVATYLHGFIRHCRVVRMANFAQLVNAIAPIFTSRQGLFLQTIYHPLRLYAEHTRAGGARRPRGRAAATTLPPEREERRAPGRVHHVADLGPFSLLDAVATCDEAGRELTVASSTATGTGPSRRPSSWAARRRPAGSLVSEVNGPEVGATNSFEHPTRVGVRERRRPRGAPARLRVPGALHHLAPAPRPLISPASPDHPSPCPLP